MTNHQVIFVLQNNKISQWTYRNGELKLCTKKGADKVNYEPSEYWREWKDENYFSAEDDVFDALFLSDTPDSFGALPDWATNKHKKTEWTIEKLELLSQDVLFKSSQLIVIHWGMERKISKNSTNGRPIKLHLNSSLGFVMPRMCILLRKGHFYIMGLEEAPESISLERTIKYHRSHLTEKIKQIKDELVQGFNLLDDKELSFILIGNDDSVLTEQVASALGSQLSISPLSLESFLIPYIDHLNEEPSLYINEFGVNFDGNNFLPQKGMLKKSEFNLFGYTVQNDQFMRFCIKNIAL